SSSIKVKARLWIRGISSLLTVGSGLLSSSVHPASGDSCCPADPTSPQPLPCEGRGACTDRCRCIPFRRQPPPLPLQGGEPGPTAAAAFPSAASSLPFPCREGAGG